jgi:hypothetical protein
MRGGGFNHAFENIVDGAMLLAAGRGAPEN